MALIAVYRISDVVMGIMANPFYVDMGFTKDEVAAVSKVFGVIMTLVGAFLGREALRLLQRTYPDYAVTALIGEKAAMACTDAVETLAAG